MDRTVSAGWASCYPVSFELLLHYIITHVQGVRLNHAIFVSEGVIFSRLGVKDGQKCPLKDSHVAAIILTTPCRISGDYPALTLFAHILLQLVSLPMHVGWETALFAGKYPMFT
jgi:hypothetical protein